MLNPEPIYMELDKRREVAYTVGSAMALRENGEGAKVMMRRLEDSSAGEPQYAVSHGVVIAWLAACLQRESRRTGDVLDREWIEDQLDTESKLLDAVKAINLAVTRYYGEEKPAGGANPPSRAGRRRGKATR